MKDRREYHKKYREEHKEERSAYQKEWRKNHPNYGREYYKKNSERIKKYISEWSKDNRDKTSSALSKYRASRYSNTHSLVYSAIKCGRLSRSPCEICGNTKSQAHHDDYNKPLEVRWLCKTCHTEWHRNNKPIYKEGK